MGYEERRNRKNYYFTGRGYIVSWQTLTVRTKDSAGGEKKAWTAKTRQPLGWRVSLSLSKGMRVKCGIRSILMSNFMRGGIVDVFFNYLIYSIKGKYDKSMREF